MAPPCRLGSIRFLFVVILLTSLLACSPQASYPLPSRDSRVELTPARLNLGKLLPGRKAAGKVLIRNLGTEMILAARFETSCPCVRATMDRTEIAPGETGNLIVEFDLAEEPDFRGSLSVEYVGKSAGGAIVLSGQVEVAVEGVPVVTGVAIAEQRQEPRQ